MKRDGRTIGVVQKPADLPQQAGYCVRLESDRTLLQHSRTGLLYKLRSGSDWPHGGYQWDKRLNGSYEMRALSATP